MARTRGRLRIEARDSDIRLPRILYGELPPFSKMSLKGLEKNPLSVVLRRYQKGELICRQGEPGWTAFYILTAQELSAYRAVPREQLQSALAERENVEKEIVALRDSLADASANDEAKRAKDEKKLTGLEEKREELAQVIEAWEQYIPYIEAAVPVEQAAVESAQGVAIVRLTVPRPKKPEPAGLLEGLKRIINGRRPEGPEPPPPKSIPIDAPRNIDYESREDVLDEGELFGEMSCMYRSPRAATVVAARDCYVLEMLRNILDRMLQIDDFKERTDRIYRERVLKLHLDGLPLLSPLEEAQREQVRQRAELVDFEAGDLIFDQHERGDCMYLIRSGVVKVIEGASALFDTGAIHSWPAVRAGLLAGEPSVEGPGAEIRKRLPAPLLDKVAATTDEPPPELKAGLIDALNDLVMDPLLRESVGFRALAREPRFLRMAWRRLADRDAASERDQLRCQRLILESLYRTALPKLDPLMDSGADDEADVSFLFRQTDLNDWQPVAAALASGSKPAATAKGGPTPQDIARGKVWELLPEPVREAARLAAQAAGPKAGPVIKKALPARTAPVETKAAGVALTQDQVRDLVAALNDVVQGHPLLLLGEISGAVRARNKEGQELAQRIRELLPGRRTWSQYDFQHQCRMFNRALVEAAFGGLRPRGPDAGPVRILAYRSRGESIGEMALLDRRPRNATCVALSHAPDDPKREVGPVQLVKIGSDLFEELKRSSDAFRQSVEAVAAARRSTLASREHAERGSEAHRPVGRVEREVADLLRTPSGEALGLIQGRRLMVIDLDRCTRCDECVQACVATHDDDRSRLFLDGPRVGKYLVPATCRSCLDPVCMIGCPVGSIHRGDNGQILIRDWCIGCKKCAEQCPYAAIQMHDVGIIPEEVHTWQFRLGGPESRACSLGSSPFVNDREFRSLLGVGEDTRDRAVHFEHEFSVDRRKLGADRRFDLSVASADEGVAVWINGKPAINGPGLEGQSPISKRERRGVGWEFETELTAQRLRAGRNVVTVRVGALPAEGGLLLKLRLSEVRQAEWEMGFVEDTAEKPIELRAVVCDLCSAQIGQRPACVTACPHDAAHRLDARALLT
jgi:Fe-S-cluster-containing hydrogenase component 2/CRP-like cAMP-binding protein